ncbi:MAG: sugar phosphate isomerase/epimerase [bacterium]
MKPLSLSTMYAQQERFSDGAEFARYGADAGYQAIEISHSTPELKIDQILKSGILPVTSFHAPAPYVKRANGRGNSSANLASTDESERTAAVDYVRVSVEWAARAGAKLLVVHLGQVSNVHEQFEQELAMRKMFDSGEIDEARFASLRAEAIEKRRLEAEPCLAAAARSLAELVKAAEPQGITVGLENRYHYHEIPGPDEYAALFEAFTPAQVGYWHDAGHAEVLDRLGFIDKTAWLNRWSGRLVGAHLHDVVGIGDHRAPRDGDVDWSYIVAGVAHLPAFTLEINQHRPDSSVRDAIGFLRGIGLG